MFRAALYYSALNQNHPNVHPQVNQANWGVSIHAVEHYYSSVKGNELNELNAIMDES